MIIWSSLNCPTVNFSHRLLFFLREATSETYGPRVSFHHICHCDLFSFAFIFRSTKPKNPKIPCCNFFYLAFDLSIFTTLSHPFANFWHRYPKGIDNPFNTSGCKYLFFVCRYCLRSVAWFSYWFDNLGLITEGNTCCCCAASSVPLWVSTDVVIADIK